MFAKTTLKKEAIKLRKDGLTYGQILARVPVAKSTVSLWLREVGLSKPQKQKITKARIEGARRGALARRTERIERTAGILTQASSEVGAISDRELWLIGVALYWAEGTKQKPHNTSAGVQFANSDPLMVNMFLKWLEQMGVPREDIFLEHSIHESYRKKVKNMLAFWSAKTGYPPHSFRSYFKRHSLKNGRRVSENYVGIIRVCVKRSTDFNRKIAGWVDGICKNCRVV